MDSVSLSVPTLLLLSTTSTLQPPVASAPVQTIISRMTIWVVVCRREAARMATIRTRPQEVVLSTAPAQPVRIRTAAPCPV